MCQLITKRKEVKKREEFLGTLPNYINLLCSSCACVCLYIMYIYSVCQLQVYSTAPQHKGSAWQQSEFHGDVDLEIQITTNFQKNSSTH